MVDLAGRIFSGGRQLAVRQAGGIALSLVNLLVLTRLIGPADYGTFAAGLGIFVFVLTVSHLGLNVYLIRRPDQPAEDEYHQAFTLYVVIGTAVALLGFTGSSLAERWTGIPGFGLVLAAMLAAMPLALSQLVPQAKLERSLDYGRIARIDLVVQATGIAVAAPLAILGYGAWAPVAGWALGQALGAVLYFAVARYRPRVVFRLPLIRPIVSYGLGFSGPGLIGQLRLLINPLIVGRLAGAEVVGIVALTVRLVEILGFMQSAGWRLAIAVFGKLQDDPVATLRRMKQAMFAQTVLVGLPLVAFTVVGPVVVPLLFGERWGGVPQIFPFLAFVYLANTAFVPPVAVLQVRGFQREIAASAIVHIVVLIALNVLLIPGHGLLGYAWSELAAIPSWAILAIGLRKRLGIWAVGPALCFALGLATMLFWRELGWFALLGIAVALAFRETRDESIGLIRILRTRLSWSS
jgi:PST family polysaccharide transporter